MRLMLYSDSNSWVVNPKDNGLISLHDFLQKDFLKQSLKKKKINERRDKLKESVRRD